MGSIVTGLQLATNPTATTTIRSTETREQCWMSWLLDKLYEGTEGRSYFATGTGLHKGFEWLIKGMPFEVTEELTLQTIATQLEEDGEYGQLWTKSRPEETWEEDVVRLLHSWYDEVYDVLQDHEVQTEVWLDVETDDFHLKTQADAILDNGGSPWIVDWKTGANKSSDDRQLHVYWWAARQLGLVGKKQEMTASFYYVHHKAWVEPKMPYPGDEAIYDMIARAEEQRRRGKYQVEPSWKCKYCQYTEVCPAWDDNESLSWPELMDLAETIDWNGVNE